MAETLTFSDFTYCMFLIYRNVNEKPEQKKSFEELFMNVLEKIKESHNGVIVGQFTNQAWFGKHYSVNIRP